MASPEDVPGLTLPGSPEAHGAMDAMGMEGGTMTEDAMPAGEDAMPAGDDAMPGGGAMEDEMSGQGMGQKP
jgi:hypothetical protein